MRWLDLRLEPSPERVARMREALGGLDVPAPVLDDARLLLSELLTNSIRHAGLSRDDRVRVKVVAGERRLRADVWDRPGAAPLSKLAGAIRPDPSRESGWGLYLVDSLTTRWGSAGGRYWFELEWGADVEGS